jgi:hypothetical protein
MERDEILNLLRRIYEGERPSEDILGKLEQSLVIHGDTIYVSHNLLDFRSVRLSPYRLELLKVRREDPSNLMIRRYDKPNIFLGRFRAVEDHSLKVDELRFFHADIKSLYGDVEIVDEKLPFRAHLTIGTNNKPFKDLPPINSNMVEQTQIRDIHHLEEVLWSIIKEYEEYDEERRRRVAELTETAARFITELNRLVEDKIIPGTIPLDPKFIKNLQSYLWVASRTISENPPPGVETIIFYPIPENTAKLSSCHRKYLEGRDRLVFEIDVPRLGLPAVLSCIIEFDEGVKPYQTFLSERCERIGIREGTVSYRIKFPEEI